MGTSSSLKGFGRIDIAVEDSEGIPRSIFEGFFLTGLHSGVINSHLEKTLQNYDANGLGEKYVGIYCKSPGFASLCQGYLEFTQAICGSIIQDCEILETSDISQYYVQGSEVRVMRTDYRRNGQKLHLYHILINIFI